MRYSSKDIQCTQCEYKKVRVQNERIRHWLHKKHRTQERRAYIAQITAKATTQFSWMIATSSCRLHCFPPQGIKINTILKGHEET